jgi:ribose/xylose/arabinose/galactoside ABC-type transport system permease subunit
MMRRNSVYGILACLLIGSALGSASGALVSNAKIQPFIATLVLMYFAPGIRRVHHRRQENFHLRGPGG